jgi:hypothetical protein
MMQPRISQLAAAALRVAARAPAALTVAVFGLMAPFAAPSI